VRLNAVPLDPAVELGTTYEQPMADAVAGEITTLDGTAERSLLDGAVARVHPSARVRSRRRRWRLWRERSADHVQRGT
jgi:hypothetical protein